MKGEASDSCASESTFPFLDRNSTTYLQLKLKGLGAGDQADLISKGPNLAAGVERLLSRGAA